MSVLSLIDKMSSHVPHPFLAPVLMSGKTRIYTVQDGVPYQWVVRVSPGWYIFNIDRSLAIKHRELDSMWGVVEYFSVLPRFLVIALWEQPEHTWVVVPYNNSDAEQRGWAGGLPRPVHLVYHAVSPLDVLVVRRLGHSLIYDNVLALKVRSPEFYQAENSVLQYQESLRQAAVKEERAVSVESGIRWHLEFMGAQLLEWVPQGESLEVRWAYQGEKYTALVRSDMQLWSAGICLSGQDRLQNLSSAVAILERAE